MFIYIQEKRKTVIVVIQARMSFQIEYSKMIPGKHLMSVFTNRSRKNAVYQA